jgi:hypothetical protein
MEDLRKLLLELEKYHQKPEVRRNSKELLADLLTDDFFEIGSSGKFFYRKDCLVEGGIGEWDLSMTDFQIHPLSEGVVLTTYRVEDKTRMRNVLRSSIWKLIDGRWRLNFHQGTIENYTGRSE